MRKAMIALAAVAFSYANAAVDQRGRPHARRHRRHTLARRVQAGVPSSPVLRRRADRRRRRRHVLALAAGTLGLAARLGQRLAQVPTGGIAPTWRRGRRTGGLAPDQVRGMPRIESGSGVRRHLRRAPRRGLTAPDVLRSACIASALRAGAQRARRARRCALANQTPARRGLVFFCGRTITASADQRG